MDPLVFAGREREEPRHQRNAPSGLIGAGARAGSANKAACTGLSTPSSRGALLCAGSRPAVVGLKGPRERRATVLLEVRRH